MALELAVGNERSDSADSVHRPRRMRVGGKGRIERCDQRIADMVHDDPAPLIDDRRHRAKETVE